MVQNPTVLIVGAGGSAPFGFPSGRGLVDLVLKDIDSAENPRGTPIERVRSIRVVSKYEELLRENPELLSRAKLLAAGLRRSGSYSLDAFVEKRREFLSECKLAIAATLVPLETERTLFSATKEGQTEVGDWYRYLANCLHDNLGRDFKQPLTILTYNYDRSLEHYLHTALCNALGLDESQTHDALSGLSFVHLHGSLGALPWQNQAASTYSRGYEPRCDIEIATKAAGQIKIIHENEDDTPDYALALDRLNKAMRVCFLGFGFHRTNVRRLTKTRWIDAAKPMGNKTVKGTSHGLTNAERIECEKRFGIYNPQTNQNLNRIGPMSMCHEGYNCLTFLRNNLDVIT